MLIKVGEEVRGGLGRSIAVLGFFLTGPPVNPQEHRYPIDTEECAAEGAGMSDEAAQKRGLAMDRPPVGTYG